MAMTSVTAGRHRFFAGGRRLHIDHSARCEFPAFRVHCAAASSSNYEDEPGTSQKPKSKQSSRNAGSSRNGRNGYGRDASNWPPLPQSRRHSTYSSPRWDAQSPQLPFPQRGQGPSQNERRGRRSSSWSEPPGPFQDDRPSNHSSGSSTSPSLGPTGYGSQSLGPTGYGSPSLGPSASTYHGSYRPPKTYPLGGPKHGWAWSRPSPPRPLPSPGNEDTSNYPGPVAPPPEPKPWARKHLEAPRITGRPLNLDRKHLEIPEKKNPNRLYNAGYGPERYAARGLVPTYEVPFEFQYTYSEVPKVQPIAERGPQFSPFGPETMDRPWTGKRPLPESKKKKYIIDSFNPPPERKHIKPVEAAGPYGPGQRPVIAWRREDIMGEPLDREEISDLVAACYKENRQLNLGRDGLTHNMLDLIHCCWKRRRVLKVRCKGVPTMDMDNVCFHLEDKTGGKIIHRQGGVVFLFRGRNYNPRFRPEIPLMLWKPPVPIYPRLVQRVPEGLTLKQAEFLRHRGRFVKCLCVLTRNGVYLNLIKNVREAFEVDELVKIDCRRMNPSDIRKIGAKLKEHLGIVILSFEAEQILLWRGPPKPTEDEQVLQEFISKTGEEPQEALADSKTGEKPQEALAENAEMQKELTPLQVRAAQELEALWQRAIDFGMVTMLDEEQMNDLDCIQAMAGAPLKLKRRSKVEEEDEEEEEEKSDEESDEEVHVDRGAEEHRNLNTQMAIEQACSIIDKSIVESSPPPPLLDGVLSVRELAKLLYSKRY